jgi:hypothetical protein
MWQLLCTGNFIAPRTNWSVRRGSVGMKTCHRLFIQSSGREIGTEVRVLC